MSSSRELLALRKDVLVARAALERLKIGAELVVLREGLQWPRTVAAVATSRPIRSALFGGLLILVGRGRVARLLGAAAAVLALAKVAAAFTQHAPETGAGEPSELRPGD